MKHKKKDKLYLFMGALFGIAGGIIGNMLVSSYFALFGQIIYTLPVFLTALFATILLLGLLVYLIEKNR